MKILFILENFADRCGANVNIAKILAKQLSQFFEVFALARYDEVQPIAEQHDSFSEVHFFYGNQLGELEKFTSGEWKNAHSTFSKIKLLLKNPKIFFSLVNYKYFDCSISGEKCRKAIEQECINNKYDIVMAVSAPYYIMKAVSDAKIACKKMAIQLDPYTNNYSLPVFFKKRRKRIEEKVIQGLDTLFAVDLVYKEIITFNVYNLEKIVPIALPSIVISEINSKNVVSGVMKEKNDKVDFVFVGQFYEEIRNPKYLLDLFLQLPENYVLNIVGGGCEQILKKYKEILKDRLILHGWVSKDEADEYIAQYDVLVNVNNTINNQMPSKLFEFIGTGKPILNVCKSEQCLSLPYIEKYNNGISVVESESLLSFNTEKIIEFIGSNGKYISDKEDIIRKFWKNTDVYVAEVIQKALNNIYEGNKVAK